LNELEPVAWLLVFVLSITAHEAAHAWAAYIGGDPTAYLGGQVSLNPLPHMKREPFGMVLIPLMTTFTNGFPIGWASTPYDPRWEELYPRRAAWMSPRPPRTCAGGSPPALRAGPRRASSRRSRSTSPPGGRRRAAPGSAGTILSIVFTLNPCSSSSTCSRSRPSTEPAPWPVVIETRRLQETFASGPLGLGLLFVWWLFPRVFVPIHGAALAFPYAGMTPS
jgi:hypothetical protein